jgi:hypothetical protein
MELIEPSKPQSNNATAILTVDEMRGAGGSPVDSAVCHLDGDTVTVEISRASLEYLSSIARHDRARQLVRAIPFAEANERHRRGRVQSFDFALAQGARTQAEVDAWHKRNRVRSRSTALPTLEVPPELDASHEATDEAMGE